MILIRSILDNWLPFDLPKYTFFTSNSNRAILLFTKCKNLAGNKLSQFGLIEDIMSQSDNKWPVMNIIIDPYEKWLNNKNKTEKTFSIQGWE